MSMIMIFETMGLLEGILPEQTKFKKTFEGSAFTTMFSSLLGTSPTVAAAESAAGIASGGRTGLMALTAGVLFALSLFFIPLLSYVPQAAIAPVIIITGAMMMQQLQYVEFNDFSEWFPAFLIVVLIPLTGSISTGLAFGFVAYPLLKLLNRQARDVHKLSWGLGFLFLMNLVFQAGF
jgi:AGZA family xanthine/uracil permease-like MFS transporter